MIIGLTGGIACGKTTAANYLRESGFIVLDADKISHEITRTGGAGYRAIRAAFGPAYFRADGGLDRRKLGGAIFADAAQRTKLEGLLHPLILDELNEQARATRERGAKVVFEDIPLLYELGMEGGFDAVWAVYCREDVQRARLMERDHLTEKEALARMASQMSAWEKARRADAVIDTSGGLKDGKRQIDNLVQILEDQRIGDQKGSAEGRAATE